MATATKTRVASDDPYKLEKLLLLPYSALVVSADGSLLRVVGVHGLGRYTGASDGGGGGNKAVAGGGPFGGGAFGGGRGGGSGAVGMDGHGGGGGAGMAEQQCVIELARGSDRLMFVQQPLPASGEAGDEARSVHRAPSTRRLTPRSNPLELS